MSRDDLSRDGIDIQIDAREKRREKENDQTNDVSCNDKSLLLRVMKATGEK